MRCFAPACCAAVLAAALLLRSSSDSQLTGVVWRFCSAGQLPFVSGGAWHFLATGRLRPFLTRLMALIKEFADLGLEHPDEWLASAMAGVL